MAFRIPGFGDQDLVKRRRERATDPLDLRRKRRSRLSGFIALEPRIMYDAAAAATAAAATDAQHHDAGSDSGAATASHTATDNGTEQSSNTQTLAAAHDASPSDGGAQAVSKEIVIIDGNLPDVQALVSGVKPGNLVFILDPDKDGVQQIADILKINDLHDLSAIQIISHGLQGEIRLGATVLTDGNLANYSAAFSDIGSALAPGGDILLYGCDVGQGAAGLRFMADLAHATGADIAAASHGVGGGNAASWVLDASTGAIQAAAPFTADTLNSYPYLLDTLSPGDIAIVSYNADDPDTFAFVALRDIGAGTVIRFTDPELERRRILGVGVRQHHHLYGRQ